MNRQLKREWLDDLPADDPRAAASRTDLQRLNFLMGHAGIMERAGRPAGVAPALQRVVEMGAGDGTFMLRLARRLATPDQKTEITLIDQQKIVSPVTCDAFARLGWKVDNAQADVFDWLSQPGAATADLMTANLFLHHFTEEQLRRMFALAAQRTNLFIACEPRRSTFALAVTKIIWLIGCNSVTRHDAAISVRAGFTGNELTHLWPDHDQWRISEQAAGLFSHCFVARRIIRP